MSCLPTIANPQRKPYPSDLSDAQWEVLKPLLPAAKGFGHPIEVDLREILNGIFYVQRTGCQWEMMPHDLPPYTTVYGYFQKWQSLWHLAATPRPGAPSTQTGVRARTALHRCHCRFSIGQDYGKKGEVYGYDGGKKVKGRKRHIVVDSQGLLIGVFVTKANASERLGAVVVLHEAVEELSRLKVIWVDQGYSGDNFAQAVKQVCAEQVRVEVIERTSKAFEVLPKRWIVERTFGWLNRFRRLSKDYELYTEVSEAMIYGSLIRLMVRRLTA
jgi:transposase